MQSTATPSRFLSAPPTKLVNIEDIEAQNYKWYGYFMRFETLLSMGLHITTFRIPEEVKTNYVRSLDKTFITPSYTHWSSVASGG